MEKFKIDTLQPGFSSTENKNRYVESSSVYRKMRSNQHQFYSNKLTLRKKKGHNFYFTSIRSHLLQVWFEARPQLQKVSKLLEDLTRKNLTFSMLFNTDLISNFWQAAFASNLRRKRTALPGFHVDLVALEEIPSLLQSWH